LKRKSWTKEDSSKGYDTSKKSHELFYDQTLGRYILKIIDVDSLLPLFIKVPSIDPRELKFTKNRKLHLQ
jgi:hypothetical protein